MKARVQELRSNFGGGYDLRTKEEKAEDEKYDAHMAGDCEWESCHYCIEAEVAAEESKGG